MTTLTFNIDLADETGLKRVVAFLQRAMGNAAMASADASGQTTARTGAAPSPTAGAKGPAAASAVAAQQASTAATAEAGNAAGAAGAAGQTAAATGASSSTQDAFPAVTFDELRKAFLGLSNSKGREACQKVLAQFKLTKLSDALPVEYRSRPHETVKDVTCEAFADVLSAIKKEAA